MIRDFIDSGKLKISILLFLMSIFCFALSLVRFWLSERSMFLFLNWNLFLAFIPWAVTTIISISNKPKNKFTIVFLLFVWLLFFPNAPYILTDLFHLRLRTAIPIWFDLILILSFAWTGLAFGFISLFDIQNFLENYFKPKYIQIAIACILFLASFGVYVGRYLRWNSWDIVNDPSSLFSDVGDRFSDPFSHPRTWGLTILMGILLNMMYWTFKFFRPGKVELKP